MQFLIDTHVLIWYLNGSNKLPVKIRELLNDDGNEVVVSIVSLWELIIKTSKHNKHKLDIDITIEKIQNYIVEHEFILLNVSLKHLNTLQTLLHHHGDPFDRMIISQAITEGLTVISADQHFSSYPINVSW